MSYLLKAVVGLATLALASAHGVAQGRRLGAGHGDGHGHGADEKPAAGKTALLIIDVQDCFLEKACTANGKDGSLAVPACDILPLINKIREEKSCL